MKILKVTLANFHGECPNMPSWWKHEKIMYITPEQIMELYATGNNIMMYHGKNINVIFVDTGRFSLK